MPVKQAVSFWTEVNISSTRARALSYYGDFITSFRFFFAAHFVTALLFSSVGIATDYRLDTEGSILSRRRAS